MADLTTKYLGLTLRNPLIVGSSGLTNNLDNILELEKAGAGAVVLKSLFEEQIVREADEQLKNASENEMIYTDKSEALDYLDMHIKEESINDYIQLIRSAKSKVNIPVIASINCVSAGEWIRFSKRIAEAGADALELNIAILPSDATMGSEEREKQFFEIISRVQSQTTIPVSIKISPYFSNLAQMIQQLSETDVSGIVLFNRFYTPDFDINNLTEISSNTYSSPSETGNVLRWMAIMSGRVSCSLAASTGIHDGEGMIKQLLAGADAVQMVSAIYKNGTGIISKTLNELEQWMEQKGYNYISQFKGKMSQQQSENPAAYERVQFMKYFSRIG